MAGNFKRKRYFVDPAFQIDFIVKFCLVVIISSLLIGVGVFLVSQNSTTVAIENTQVMVKSTSDFILPYLTFIIFVVALFSAAGVLVLAVLVSHRIAGPVFRLTREINLLKEGDLGRNFNIRNKDQLQALAESLETMGNVLKDKHRQIKEKTRDLKQYLTDKKHHISDEGQQQIEKILNELETILNYFKF